MKGSPIKIHFLSVECYPMAKVGGLADVVGALPKYLNKAGCEVTVIMPRYDMKWFKDKEYKLEYQGHYWIPQGEIHFQIQEVVDANCGFRLLVVDIPGKFDRDGVYADTWGHFFTDEVERFCAFQRAYLYYAAQVQAKPDIVHCHDHHTGLTPFMMKHCEEYRSLAAIPTVFTIHNQAYQGRFSWSKQQLLPEFDHFTGGLLEWGGVINPLASAVKCAWKITTVSPSYMEEIKHNSYGLEALFQSEAHKSMGILNGIDNEVWNPTDDPYLESHLSDSVDAFKYANKSQLLANFRGNKEWPLCAFIGRFAGEKGADLLPNIIATSIQKGIPMNFIVLGTGDKSVEHAIGTMAHHMPDRIIAHLTYNEKLSHTIYAGADFIIMPSRVEPCGLNQMYAMRYGTIPIVHNLGGLKDSVKYFDGEEGQGLKFNDLGVHTIMGELHKATYLYNNQDLYTKAKSNAMKMQLSWEVSAQKYIDLYKSLF